MLSSSIVFGCFLGLACFLFALIRAYAPKLTILSVFATIAADIFCVSWDDPRYSPIAYATAELWTPLSICSIYYHQFVAHLGGVLRRDWGYLDYFPLPRDVESFIFGNHGGDSGTDPGLDRHAKGSFGFSTRSIRSTQYHDRQDFRCQSRDHATIPTEWVPLLTFWCFLSEYLQLLRIRSSSTWSSLGESGAETTSERWRTRFLVL